MSPQELINAIRAQLARIYGSVIGDAIDMEYHCGWFYPTLSPRYGVGFVGGGTAYRRAKLEAMLETLRSCR